MSGNRNMAKAVRFIRKEFGESLQFKQFAILLNIALSHPEPVTYTDLEKNANTTSGTVSRTIALYGSKMVEVEGTWKDIGSGLVESRPNPYNTRQYQATLTARGVEVFRTLDDINS